MTRITASKKNFKPNSSTKTTTKPSMMKATKGTRTRGDATVIDSPAVLREREIRVEERRVLLGKGRSSKQWYMDRGLAIDARINGPINHMFSEHVLPKYLEMAAVCKKTPDELMTLAIHVDGQFPWSSFFRRYESSLLSPEVLEYLDEEVNFYFSPRNMSWNDGWVRLENTVHAMGGKYYYGDASGSRRASTWTFPKEMSSPTAMLFMSFVERLQTMDSGIVKMVVGGIEIRVKDSSPLTRLEQKQQSFTLSTSTTSHADADADHVVEDGLLVCFKSSLQL